jgi:inner membrane protein involved in colicin E2 resistance
MNKNWLPLYALVAFLAVIAALVIIILSGNDLNLLVAALITLVPVLTGVGVLVKQGDNQAALERQKGGMDNESR